MSIVEVKVPQLSESVAEATLLQWKKQPGEAVAIDEILIEIETDKVVLEVPAPAAGVLAEHVVAGGGTVVSDQVIATHRHRGHGSRRSARACGRAGTGCRCPGRCPPARKAGVAMPAAAKLMADHGMAAGSVAGTGQRRPRHQGRRAGAAAAPAPAAPAPVAVAPVAGRGQAAAGRRGAGVPTWRPRPSSACRCRACARASPSGCCSRRRPTPSSPPSTRSTWPPVMELRKRYQERFEKEHGVKLGFMSLLRQGGRGTRSRSTRCSTRSVDGNDIVYHGYFDIGIAVGSTARPGGADPARRGPDVGFAEIEKKIAEYGQRPRDGKLSHGRAHRRHLHDHQRRRLRLDAVHAHHQPAAERDPGRAHDPGPRRGGERAGGGAPDERTWP
jgi:2-oxoglutarate dehydrogenase E2 component (dihydrolipoamide succinyltransferase)